MTDADNADTDQLIRNSSFHLDTIRQQVRLDARHTIEMCASAAKVHFVLAVTFDL